MNIYNNGNATLTVGDIERMQQRIAELERENTKLRSAFFERKEMCRSAHEANERLSVQNAELVAQVERMATFIQLSAKKWEGVSEVEPTFLNLLRVASAEPAQCLNQIKAEAFVAGIRLRSKGPCNDWHKAAEEYAERVKAGEV